MKIKFIGLNTLRGDSTVWRSMYEIRFSGKLHRTKGGLLIRIPADLVRRAGIVEGDAVNAIILSGRDREKSGRRKQHYSIVDSPRKVSATTVPASRARRN